MSLFQQLQISSSALSAYRLAMDVTASNIANATTTRGRYVNGEWIPYRRKVVEIAPREQTSFASFLEMAVEQQKGRTGLEGVRVTGIVEDPTPFKQLYDPSHPDANEQGYVRLPNVDLTREMVDLLTAARAYEANVTAFNAGKNMDLKALEIGR